MNPIIAHIRQLYGDACRLCPPLEQTAYEQAGIALPEELLALLRESNGILELMPELTANDGGPLVSGWVVYPLDEIRSNTAYYANAYGGAGTVFAGNGAGGYFLLMPDGTVWLKEFFDEDAERYAESLTAFFGRWHG